MALSGAVDPLPGMGSLDAVNTLSGAALSVAVNPVADARLLFFRPRTPDLVDGDGFVARERPSLFLGRFRFSFRGSAALRIDRSSCCCSLFVQLSF